MARGDEERAEALLRESVELAAMLHDFWTLGRHAGEAERTGRAFRGRDGLSGKTGALNDLRRGVGSRQSMTPEQLAAEASPLRPFGTLYLLLGSSRLRNSRAISDSSPTRSTKVSSLPHSHAKVRRPSAYQSSSRPSRTSRSPQPHSRTIRPEGSISEQRRTRTLPPPVPLCTTTFARPECVHNVNLVEVDCGYALGAPSSQTVKIRSRFMVLGRSMSRRCGGGRGGVSREISPGLAGFGLPSWRAV